MTTTQEAPSQAVLEISGDVDTSSGHVEVASDIRIAGTVREGYSVKSAGNITIGGAVEAAANVEAAGYIRVHGGITTQHKGQVTAGGAIHTHFCDEADLSAGGDVVVAGGAINSHVHTMGRLLVEQGALVGGKSYAREGAVIKILGNDNNLKTQVAIGVNPEVLAGSKRLAKDLKKQKDASARIRETVQPLLAQLKRLNPQQRERATELIYQADSIDAQVQEQLQSSAQALAACTPSGPAELLVTERLFPGITVIFGDKTSTIQQEHQGPVRLSRRQINRIEEIILEQVATGQTSTLVSHEYTPETGD